MALKKISITHSEKALLTDDTVDEKKTIPASIGSKIHKLTESRIPDLSNENGMVQTDVSVLEIASLDAPEKKGQIESFLNEYGLVLIKKEAPVEKGVEYLARMITSTLPDAGDFLHLLRTANCGSKEFAYNMKNLDNKQREKVNYLAGIMKQCGVFTELQTFGSCLKGKMSSAGRVINFVNGKWLEIHFQSVTAEIAAEYAEKYSLPYEVLTNVIIENASHTQRHEIDCMFSIGNAVFGTEQKSGSGFADYDKYRKVGEYLHIIPDRFLLLNSTLENINAAQCVRYFYQYYVCNLSTFRETIHTMIQNFLNN